MKAQGREAPFRESHSRIGIVRAKGEGGGCKISDRSFKAEFADLKNDGSHKLSAGIFVRINHEIGLESGGGGYLMGNRLEHRDPPAENRRLPHGIRWGGPFAAKLHVKESK